jgi:hypothetical protein
MFGVKAEQVTEQLPVEPPAPVRQKVAARDARIFTQGSTFAERKAQAEANRATLAERRLVSLGQSEFAQRDQRTGKIEFIPSELFCDVDHPMKRYVTIDGLPGLIALNSDDSREQVTPLPGSIQHRGRPSTREPSPTDPPPRPV